MRFGPLKDIDASVFNQAFFGYAVPFHFSPAQLQWNLKKNSFDLRCSVGLYDGSSLCGFILNGRRGNEAYDCGTAILPEYRGHGYAHLLVERAKSALAEAGADTWKLEVLSTNTKAVKLYQEHGFTSLRDLACFRILTSDLSPSGLVQLVPGGYDLLPSSPECRSSWQNETESIRLGQVSVYAIVAGSSPVGALAISKKSGSLMQLYIQPQFRGREYAKAALSALPSVVRNPEVKFINVDDGYLPMIHLLGRCGFFRFATQHEMQTMVKSAIV
jgi:GNAT superfamily N-acetyltransferase